MVEGLEGIGALGELQYGFGLSVWEACHHIESLERTLALVRNQ